jgi:hypothetical protein
MSAGRATTFYSGEDCGLCPVVLLNELAHRLQ